MKFSALLFVAAATAAPGAINQNHEVQAQEILGQDLAVYVPCPGPLQVTPLCCATILQGVSLQCQSPPTPPANATDFVSVCGAILPLAKRPRCCTFSIFGVGVICTNPIGVLALDGEEDDALQVEWKDFAPQADLRDGVLQG
ncbi:uncharacterized protein J7T54_002487 [Emericellopsis cladophorae]|uniref:Hydrophobin n=1 Tax=Emericellopsis cladophorae TaxID=2686198 RepID=A0A9Q0BDS6_9HYPO|nr:uncharacterized protein J7T54_002487 [Emericellopsis cladophorae]KAI6781131.1 hypothetical protein J7T54_002487 [Emericellopsis cladophorae]